MLQTTKYLSSLNWYLDHLGLIVSDFFEEYEMRLTHSKFLPDEQVDERGAGPGILRDEPDRPVGGDQGAGVAQRRGPAAVGVASNWLGTQVAADKAAVNTLLAEVPDRAFTANPRNSALTSPGASVGARNCST